MVHLGMGRLDLVEVLAGIVQGQQRRGLQAALLGGGRLGAGSIAARGVLALGPQLLPQQAQEEVAKRVGVQSSGIVGRGGLDQAVALEGVRDATEVGVFETVLGDSAEQQEGFERRVRCRRSRRSRHAPDSAPRGTEGAAAALDKMNRRHDLRWLDVVSGVCLSASATAAACGDARRPARQNTYRQPEPGAPVNSRDGRVSLRWTACDRAGFLSVAGQSPEAGDEFLRSRWLQVT